MPMPWIPLPSAPPRRSTLRISVVISTCPAPGLLRRCLDAVCAQQIEPGAYEVIVVDGPGTAGVVAAARRGKVAGPLVRVVGARDDQGMAVARNAGWRAAYGAVIAFIDADTAPGPHWLVEGERALGPELVAVSGRVIGALERGSGGQPSASESFTPANAFVRRSALLAVGGFDERFGQARGADWDMQVRLQRDAGAIGRSTAAVVIKTPAQRWGMSLHQQRQAFFDALLYKKHPRLYRQRIASSLPWSHYLVVLTALAAPPLWAMEIGGSALTSLLLASIGILRIALGRLGGRLRAPRHIIEVMLTSMLIPFLSVYWRLRGAVHFRVLFL